MIAEEQPTLADTARLFARLGFTAFGGPAAHIAMMQREFVDRRGWIDRERFLDMVGAVNLLPGPNSTELAISIGAELHGWRGLVVAGVCFITPAFTIVLILAWIYRRYGALPDVTAVMAGVKPVVLAIIVQALWKLAPPIAKRPALIAVAVAAVAAAILGAHEVIILIGGGLVSVGLGRLGKPNDSDDAGAGNSAAPGAKRPGRRFKPMQLFGVGFLSGLVGAPTVGGVFLYFLYLGCVLYGSGYVLVAFLSRDLLAFGWITRPQLLDAIAIGQVTPGPLFTTATFIGYLVQGVPGSIAATVGIFLPSFIFVLLTHRWIARLRQRRSTALFLDGVNAGAVGLIAVALILLGASTLTTPFTWIVAVASLAVLLPTRVNPMWLIGVGALAGWLVAMLG